MTMLPNEFADLEPFASKWCRATEKERWNERMSTPLEQLQEFYDAALPRVPAALEYCDRFPLAELPEDALNLLRLVYSFVLISFPVELWAQHYPPDTKGTEFVRLSEPIP